MGAKYGEDGFYRFQFLLLRFLGFILVHLSVSPAHFYTLQLRYLLTQKKKSENKLLDGFVFLWQKKSFFPSYEKLEKRGKQQESERDLPEDGGSRENPSPLLASMSREPKQFDYNIQRHFNHLQPEQIRSPWIAMKVQVQCWCTRCNCAIPTTRP
jgi:hypothetical protein